MSADAAAADADADAAAERRLNYSIPRTYFVRGIQLPNNAFMTVCSYFMLITLIYLLIVIHMSDTK